MGKFSFNVSDEFTKQLGRLLEVEEVAPQMIDECMPIIEDKLRKEMAWHSVSGKMQSSVKSTRAKKMKRGGYYAVSKPTGEDDDGTRNVEKLVYLEYGTSKQNATPIIARVLKDCEDTVLNKMQTVFEREMKK